MMKKLPPKLVLIFNKRKKLVSITGSVYEASKISGLHPGNISRACNGELMSTGQCYFRYIDPSIEIELSDINNLKVDDYDRMCGKDRKIYETQDMNRKNFKYNKSKEQEDEN